MNAIIPIVTGFFCFIFVKLMGVPNDDCFIVSIPLIIALNLARIKLL